MKYIIVDGVVLSRPLEGPLAAHIRSFARSTNEQGYRLCSLHRQVLIGACFSRWLGQNGVRLRSVSFQHAEGYLRYRERRVRLNRGDAAALRHLIEFLRREGVIAGEKVLAPRPTGVERCAQEYERYLREERVLATATVLNYVPFVRCFLKDRFGNETVQLSRLCAGDIIRFVERQARRQKEQFSHRAVDVGRRAQPVGLEILAAVAQRQRRVGEEVRDRVGLDHRRAGVDVPAARILFELERQ